MTRIPGYLRRDEAKRVASHVHRAQRQNLGATLTVKQWLDTLNQYLWRCAYCGGPFECLEHLVPEQLGGPTTAQNCYPACRACNRRKAGIDPRMGYVLAFGGDVQPTALHSTPMRYPPPQRRSPSRKMPRPGCTVLQGFIATLKNLQGDRSQAMFAAELEISESMLSRIYSGERIPAQRCIGRIIRAKPSLREDAMNVLLCRKE